MASIMERLERGERCWPAEIALRSAGLVALYACGLLSRILNRLVTLPPAHPGSSQEFAIAAAIWVCLSTGLALAFGGPGLLQAVPMPPRALIQ